MIRTLFLSTLLATGLSFHALAADEGAAPADAAAVAANSAQLTVAASAETARKLLGAQGYSNVSELQRDEQGRWTGTALKDGKIVGVAIALPRPANVGSTTN